MKLRPYQQEAVDKTVEIFKEKSSALAVMATGLGKTIFFSHVIKAENKRTMVIAHREELIFQAADKIKAITGEEPDIEMAGSYANRLSHRPVVVATVQTLSRGRMEDFNPEDFGLLVIDECFPAGTSIDGKAIETLNIGDIVRSYNHETLECEDKKVIRKFKNKAYSIAQITLSNGTQIACTPNHPIWSYSEYRYIPAMFLDSGCVVCYIERHDMHLQNMRQIFRGQEIPTSNLLTRLFKGGHLSENGKDKQESRFSEDEEKQSYAQAGDTSQGVRLSQGAMSYCEGREREGTDLPRKIASSRPGRLDVQPCCEDENAKGKRVSNLLQNRRRQQSSKNWCGNRRTEPQAAGETGTRQEETGTPRIVRVEDIKIFKRGCDPEFDLLCPDGYVYNVEVEDNNNYFAENLLVHNCHHAVSASYRNVINHFKQNLFLKVLGVTATPDRTDEAALGQIFEDVSYEYGIAEGVDDGWLSGVIQNQVFVNSLDFSNINTRLGDLAENELAAIMEFEENLHGVVSPVIKIAGDRKTLVFASSVAHAERMSEIFNRHEPGSSNFVTGTTPKDVRREVFADFHRGKIKRLCNVGVATEGFDEPGIQVVAMARPTKSRCLYTQMIGRGCRPSESIAYQLNECEDTAERRRMIAASDKPSVEIIDFTGNCGRHKLVSTADILGGKYPDEVVELTKSVVEQKTRKGVAVDMPTELKKVEAELRRRRRMCLEAKMRQDITLNAKFAIKGVDPFDILDITPRRIPGWSRGKEPTENMRKFLERRNVNVDDMNFIHAGQLIGEIRKREGEAGVMPFGKHCGQPLKQVPHGYRKWCLEQTWLKPDLRKLIEESM